ncbi:MAG: hypothetical protein ACR2RB_09455 [Gammaproteobacteria bacterium]
MDSEQYQTENFCEQDSEELVTADVGPVDIRVNDRPAPTRSRAVPNRTSDPDSEHLNRVYAEMRRLRNKVSQLETDRDILRIAFTFLRSSGQSG